MNDFKQVEEVSTIFNVGIRTVYSWIKGNQIKAVRVGKRYYISNEELEYIKKNGLRK